MADNVNVLVGTIGRAHGLRGEVSVNVRTDEPERRFAVGAEVEAHAKPGATRTLTVRTARQHSGTLLVGFDGVTDRTGAEALRGLELWVSVPADEAPADDGAFYDRQLVGLEVRDHTGRRVGQVREVLHLPAHDTLAVVTSDGERLVPFVEALVPVVDMDAGYVQVADVGGLLRDEE